MKTQLFILALAAGLVGLTGCSTAGSTTPTTPPSSKITPAVAWATPASITAGTPLSSTQLNATASANGASVAGTFAYNPPAGTVLAVGANQPLSVAFTPDDPSTYTTSSGNTTITVMAPQSVVMVAYMDDEQVSNACGGTDAICTNIYTFPLSNSSNRTRITVNSPAENWSPSISPDRTLIAFTANIPGGTCTGCGNYAIYYIKSDGTGTQTPVTNGFTGTTSGVSYDPDWSPDGTKLSFAYIDETRPAGGMTAGIGIWDKTTNTTTLLAATEEVHATGGSISIPGHTRFLPDGRVVYTSARSGNWQNYVVSADGSTIINLNNNSSNDGEATPSPDGTKLAFESDRSGVNAIYTMTITGGNVTQVSFPSAGDPVNVFDSDPAWTPDGTLIIFTAHKPNGGLDTVKSDGSNGEVPLLANWAASSPYCR
jgi:Tol biopolymer transport system component